MLIFCWWFHWKPILHIKRYELEICTWINNAFLRGIFKIANCALWNRNSYQHFYVSDTVCCHIFPRSYQKGVSFKWMSRQYLYGIFYEWPSQCKTTNISHIHLSSPEKDFCDKWLKFSNENPWIIIVLENLWNQHHNDDHGKDEAIL